MPVSAFWLDCDPGFDDWMAWLLLEALAVKLGKTQLAGVSCTHGNTSLPNVMSNAQNIASLMRWPVPIYSGAYQALAGEGETAERVLGPQGMRTSGAALPAAPSSAVALSLQDGLASLTRPGVIIALGPLTNLACQLLPHWGWDTPIVWMGGSTDRGNHTAAAEFNALADPEAASKVFSNAKNIRMVGLNVCREILLAKVDLQKFSSLRSEQARVFTGHLEAYQAIRSADGARPMPLYDPVAVAAALHPEWFEFSPARVDVECKGDFTRGMTVCEFRLTPLRQANAQVATAVQANTIKEWILQTAYSYLLRYEEAHDA
jgi:purine nucleosidase